MERVSDVLIEVARVMFAVETVDEALQVVVDAAPRAVPGVHDAAVVLIRGDDLTVPAATSSAARSLEEAESALGFGPCVQALQDHAVFTSDDLALEERWPEWTAQALDVGYRSLLAFRLFVGGDSFGALDLFSRTPSAFDRDAEAAGLALAGHGAIALANVFRDETAAGELQGLRNALVSRDEIGQAKGILMERMGLTADQAFGRLQQVSQERNVKVRDIAAEVVLTGELPR